MKISQFFDVETGIEMIFDEVDFCIVWCGENNIIHVDKQGGNGRSNSFSK